MAEGVGNPVYDSFNEGQPLEEVSDATGQRSIRKQQFRGKQVELETCWLYVSI